jgi:L-fuculose-phosphate aldolase
MGWQKEKEMVLAAARQMLAKGLVTGTAGNVSLRLPSRDGRSLLAITPSSREYDSLSAGDIQILDFEAQKVEGNLVPSIETAMHIVIYRARQDVNAIIHTHSVFATAVAVTGQKIPPILDEQVIYLGGEVNLAAYAICGSPELAGNAVTALGGLNAVLLANHGAVSVGRDMLTAFRAAELVEKTARIYLLALAAGKVVSLTVEAQSALRMMQTGTDNAGI